MPRAGPLEVQVQPNEPVNHHSRNPGHDRPAFFRRMECCARLRTGDSRRPQAISGHSEGSI